MNFIYGDKNMEIKLKKQIETLEREITIKYVDLDENIKDFNV